MAEFIKIKDIKPHPENPRTHTEEQIQKIANSIKELTWGRPIIISSDNYILAGEGAYLAAKNVLKHKEVPFRRMKHMHNSPEAIAYMLADNKLGEESDWNYGKLQNINDNLKLAGFNVTLTGFDEIELQEIETKISNENEIVEDEFNPEELDETGKPSTNPGDIYQLGDHRLMCGDSTKKEDVQLLMNGKKADMVFTDPPYGVDYEDSFGRSIKNDNLKKFNLNDFYSNLYNYMDEDTAAYVCYAQLNVIQFMESAKKAGFNYRNTIIWLKDVPAINFGHYTWIYEPILYLTKGKPKFYGQMNHPNIFKVPSFNSFAGRKDDQGNPVNRSLHPNQKPIKVPSIAIQNSSPKNSIILDLFGGSGSTLIACEQTDRTAYLMELDPHYCDVIIDRWEEFTGETAIKIT